MTLNEKRIIDLTKKILNGKLANPIYEYPELDGFNPYKTKLLKCWYIKLTSMQTET